ncbi:SUMF1/EgtB/PvdO family nonheme iron enzyme [Duganella sp. BJB1802]|uniref:formylglycine-generating enzyme family protein n=1 Tax=Duganella sp. BJB1802 TaxID=2744575 RepID=UPI001E517A0A|nr:SUMF1/EgtB/PvdO family nonheme iron enzyme [Duganella sp. BJB1802]
MSAGEKSDPKCMWRRGAASRPARRWGAPLLALCALQFAHAAEPLPFAVRESQLTGPAQMDLGEVDWLARLNNWKRDTAGAQPAWLAAMQAWRAQHLAAIAYDDAQYRRPELQWTQKNFIQTQAMVEDRYLYDPITRRYTVQRFLDDLKRRYGGIDSVLLWPLYPNMGIDHRNQWDLLRDMPGGTDAVRQMVRDFHDQGVRVLFPTLPWDAGSRDPGLAPPDATARLMAEIGADGINGDTMNGLPQSYADAAARTGHPLVLEPELSFKDDAMLATNLHSWAYWDGSFVPLVSKWKWLEPRHMAHVSDRWATDRSNTFQAAFFNGVGVQSWENVWGWWNQMTPRDGEALRRISTIYRAVPALLVSAQWTPHVPTLHYGIYASRFPGAGRSLWTLVNRNEFQVKEGILKLEHRAGQRYLDLWNGRELQPRIEDGQAVIDLPLEARGYGAVLQFEGAAIPSELAPLLETMSGLARTPLQAYSADWTFLPQKIVPIAATARAAGAPAGMVSVPAGSFDFRVTGIEIEGENRPGMDVQYPWEDSPRRGHFRHMRLDAFHIDRYPVSNLDFKRFIDSAGYRPADAHNFLRHWQGGAPRPAEANSPVTWVSIEDARAYCRAAGKRLPHEWEWQFAAQGNDGRLYPWGNEWDAALVPAPSSARELPPLPPVGQHPKGASPFGVEDMVATVWQWTEEFEDEHTRAAILRGGSFYQPAGSHWYFPQARKLTEHGKYLLMAPSKDRAGALGFRCAQDAG